MHLIHDPQRPKFGQPGPAPAPGPAPIDRRAEIEDAIVASVTSQPSLFNAGRRARVRGVKEPSREIAQWDGMAEQIAWLAGWHRADRLIRAGYQVCRVCGCDDAMGCDGPEPCWWVEEDLCSACVVDAEFPRPDAVEPANAQDPQ